MRRRAFLTGLSASLLAIPALARPRQVKLPAFAFTGKTRIGGLKVWTDGKVAKPKVQVRTGRNGSHIITLKSLTPAALPATAVFGLAIGPVLGFKRGGVSWHDCLARPAIQPATVKKFPPFLDKV